LTYAPVLKALLNSVTNGWTWIL